MLPYVAGNCIYTYLADFYRGDALVEAEVSNFGSFDNKKCITSGAHGDRPIHFFPRAASKQRARMGNEKPLESELLNESSKGGGFTAI